MAKKEKYLSIRKDGRWELRMQYGYNTDGTPARLREYFRSRDEARARRDYLLAQKGQGKETRATGYTLGQWAVKCLELYGNSLQPNTYIGYESRIRIHILSAPIAGLKLESVDTVALQSWIKGLKKQNSRGEVLPQPLSPKSVSNLLGIMNWLLSNALRAGLISQRPNTASLVLPKRQHPRRNTMTPEICSSLLDSLQGSIYRTILLFALTSGLRTSEIFGLCWDCVELDTGKYTVRRKLTLDKDRSAYHIVGTMKSDNAYRTGLLVPELLAAFRLLQQQQRIDRLAAGPLWQNTGAVFVREDGAVVNPRALRSIIRYKELHLGLPSVGMHGLRHLYATSLIRQHVDDATIARQLGHSSADFTRRQYADVYEDSARIAADAGSVLLAQIASKSRQPS